MKKTTRTFAAALALATVTGAAQAGSYDPPVLDDPYVPPAPAVHDWSGFYMDAFAGHWATPPVGNFFGANLGYNMSNGSLVYGGELGVIHDPSLALTGVSITGRVGVAAGSNLLLFARLGASSYDVALPGLTNIEYGLGAQVSVWSNMYLRGDVVVIDPTTGAPSATQVRVGAGWEF